MPETVEKPEDRSVEELMDRLKQSMKDIKEGNTYTVEELKEEIEGK